MIRIAGLALRPRSTRSPVSNGLGMANDQPASSGKTGRFEEPGLPRRPGYDFDALLAQAFDQLAALLDHQNGMPRSRNAAPIKLPTRP
jgi:hypothetical protein